MTTRNQLLLGVAFLGLLDIVFPFFPILALVLVYVILDRPPWFHEWVQEIYKPD